MKITFANTLEDIKAGKPDIAVVNVPPGSAIMGSAFSNPTAPKRGHIVLIKFYGEDKTVYEIEPSRLIFIQEG